MTKDEREFINVLGNKTMKSYQLQEYGGFSSRYIRTLVNSLRKKGVPVCGNNNGYYIAKNKNELRQEIMSLYSRIKETQDVIDGLEKTLKEWV